MYDFLNELDYLCFKYGYHIKPSNRQTIVVDSRNGEKFELPFVDGDGMGE
jgi:hypothetical protein